MTWTPTASQIEAARHLLWYHGHPAGIQPGDFHHRLIGAMVKADQFNLARITGAFPEYGPGLRIITTFGAAQLARWIDANTREPNPETPGLRLIPDPTPSEEPQP